MWLRTTGWEFDSSRGHKDFKARHSHAIKKAVGVLAELDGLTHYSIGIGYSPFMQA